MVVARAMSGRFALVQRASRVRATTMREADRRFSAALARGVNADAVSCRAARSDSVTRFARLDA